MPIGTWLLAMVSPLLGRILLSLGFSVVSIVGMDALMTTIKAQLVAQMSAIPAAGLNLALLAGAGQALGIIFGAITTRLLLWKITSATRLLGVNT